MAEVVQTGQEKYLNYVEQFRRLKKALDSEFYLEAIFIEYAILEDRTESVLTHAGLWNACKNRNGKKPGIEAKLNFMRTQAANPGCSLHKYFSDDLLEQLKAWKNKRNPLIHALLKQKLGPDDLKNLAYEGDALVKELRTRATTHNRWADKQKEKKAAKK